MPRLLRPHIPVELKCRVALRQLGETCPAAVIALWRSLGLGRLLESLLMRLAPHLDCSVAELRLDHDPALATRRKVFRKGVHVGYRPAANDPAHLIYRSAAGHHIKTQVKGDGAQYPDRVLIMRERRRTKKKHSKTKRKWPPRSFPKTKRKIQSRPFRGPNQ